MKKLLIAGTNSGVGKTTLTLGIMKALKGKGLKVQPFKVGPDYIDTAYHTHITGSASRNLDGYMLQDDMLKYLFNKTSKDADVAIVEGVMGLYDGYGIDINCCSSSYISKLLKLPVILVIDAKAMAASGAAMVLGYKMLDPGVNLKGVIANNVKTPSHFKLVKDAVEKYTGVEVLGYFPPNPDFALPSRHLGLVPSQEMEELEEKLTHLGEEITKYIDIDRMLELCESEDVTTHFKPTLPRIKGKVLALAYDKAFNFYYEDNLELLEEIGLSIKKFSPLEDNELPVCDYIYIGGGFPEVFAKKLEQNKSMRSALKEAHHRGIPIYAECGGLMYLGERLKTLEGELFEMVGIFKGQSIMTKGLKRFGYCEGEAQLDTILSKVGTKIKGHEFHHSEFQTDEKEVYIMTKERDGKIVAQWSGGYSKGNTLATYLHLHFYSNLSALNHFLNDTEDLQTDRRNG
ncbi:cobyrinate a,c-diamide synthase [Cellulosilyticum sp. I15G10I2]|uniref:cobyrinate a,c-diamide synthase n=1 Tax=Cellulosilyticum sp. I15G10I2 TaxID=1892843 RepID=UPI00085C0FA2|nr:cobyrinate a,c-diamide synthase [Cellulosilyticum sp. I15G10I2]